MRCREAQGHGRPDLEQVRVEHGPHNQLLHQLLGSFLACNIVPGHSSPPVHHFIAHQLHDVGVQLLQSLRQLSLRICGRQHAQTPLPNQGLQQASMRASAHQARL